MTAILKLFQVLPLIIVSVFGMAQVIVKAIKEVVTACINVLFPLFPDNGKFESTIIQARNIVDKVDAWLEVVKVKILKPIGLNV